MTSDLMHIIFKLSPAEHKSRFRTILVVRECNYFVLSWHIDLFIHIYLYRNFVLFVFPFFNQFLRIFLRIENNKR